MARFTTKTNKTSVRFSIPKPTLNELGLRGDGDSINLTISGPTGHFKGTKVMRSGTEVYGKDLAEHGIGRDQTIVVTVSPVAEAHPRNLLTQKRKAQYSPPSETHLSEGEAIQVLVNRYERSEIARKRCIEIFGTQCCVCNFDFEKTYGEIGRGFIHVHHLNPLSTVKKKQKIEPRKHLRPVCPNCHEMLHRGKPLFSIEELKKRLG
ncbi:MAG: hypothetical protein WBD10_10345 [Acidobacteriaceae bacterium]